MGKKGAKKGGKKKAASSGDGGADGNLDQLQEKVTSLETDKVNEEKLRNYVQLERDKIHSFWEITKQELDDVKAELRNKDREMEELEERHQVEIKVYKQKVKHLLYEHQNNISTLKAEGELALKKQQDEFLVRDSELQKDKRSLKQELKEKELANEHFVRQLKLEHAKEITKLRQEFELQARELQQKYEKKMKLLRDDLELRRKQEIHEIEERKNTHINELMKKHERAFSEIKNYYNDITHNNLDLIKTLKEDVADMKKREAASDKLMHEILQDKKSLSEPLAKTKKENEALKHSLANYEKDKVSLSHTKARLLETEKQLRNLEWEHEVFQQKFLQVQAERDDIYEKFENSIYDVQQKSGLKSMMLEKRIELMQEDMEKKDAQIGQILTAANLDPTTVAQVNKKVEEELEKKNQVIKALQYDVAKVSKAHNDLIRVYEAKLAEFGVPIEELGFRPLMTNTSTGPAGLVVGA